MSASFHIKPGIYDVPKVGKVNALQPVSDETALKLYKLKRGVFPFIAPNEKTLAFLKKQKLKAEDIAPLIQNAQTEAEVELLLELTKNKTIKRIAEVKLNSLRPKEIAPAEKLIE